MRAALSGLRKTGVAITRTSGGMGTVYAIIRADPQTGQTGQTGAANAPTLRARRNRKIASAGGEGDFRPGGSIPVATTDFRDVTAGSNPSDAARFDGGPYATTPPDASATSDAYAQPSEPVAL